MVRRSRRLATPRRPGTGRDATRRAVFALAGGLLLAHPLRFAGLGLAMALVVAVSIVLTAAILTISVAFVALVACRSVYPAADRLEPALGGERP